MNSFNYKTQITIALLLFMSATHIFAERYALMVGVDKYESSYNPGALSSCVNDAYGLYNSFVDDTSRWNDTNITLQLNAAATKSMIRTNFNQMAEIAVAGDVVVYFQSSHGGEHSGTDTFICTYNSNYEDYEFAEDLALFADGVKVIVLIDTCSSGGMPPDELLTLSELGDSPSYAPAQNPSWNFAQNVMTHYSSAPNTKSALKKSGITKSPSVGWITACRYDELSLAGTSYSLFTEKIIYSFMFGDQSGNGALSFQEIYDYAAPRVLVENPTQTVQIFNGSLLSSIEALDVMTADPTIQDALNQSMLIHSKPGPSAHWFSQINNTHSGISAVQSGSISDDQAVEFGIKVIGPGTLSFWWKTSSEINYDGLSLEENGITRANISGETGWIQESIQISPGEHVLRWIYSKDESSSEGSDCGWVDQLVWTPDEGQNKQSLAEAIDAPELFILTDHSIPWFSQTNTTYYGASAAQSGACTDQQTSWFSTQLIGPGTFSFWWKVSSEEDFDFLNFYIDETLTERISGPNVAWQQKSYSLDDSIHTVSWCYTKDLSDQNGDDCGWVDRIIWTGHQDVDDDGQDNLQEYIAGTDPTNAASFFRIEKAERLATGMKIEWEAVPGRTYSLVSSSNLLVSFQPLVSGITAPTNYYIDTEINQTDQLFYKIKVELE